MVSAEEALHVVIPTWRGRDRVAALLANLGEQTRQPAAVWVVDGGSADGTAEAARGVNFVDLGVNRGFAAAVNAGVRACGGQRIAVLNNDVRLAPDWLEKMQRTQAPFAVGKVMSSHEPGVLDATWDLVSESGVPLRAGCGCRDGAYWNEGREIGLAPWTAIVITRDYWQSLRGLDESFESYLEDVDIGLRGLRLGYRGWYEPSAVCWHEGSATLGAWHPRQVRLTARNQWRLVRRHGRPDWWKVVVGQGLWGLAAARHGCLSAWWAGKWEAWQEAAAGVDDGLLGELEQELFDVTAHTGMDRYWRWYWALTL